MPDGIMDYFFSKVNQKVNQKVKDASPPAHTSLYYRTDFCKTCTKMTINGNFSL